MSTTNHDHHVYVLMGVSGSGKSAVASEVAHQLQAAFFDVIESRLKARKGHFFKTQMLVTQFEALEEPGANENDVLVVDIDQPLDGVVASTIEVINQGSK